MATAEKPKTDTQKPDKSRTQTQTENMNAFRRFIDEFKNESDRAAVILGAAKLDLLLYQLLQATLCPSTARADELLDGDSPLATFSARIGLCHRLGLIDDNFCRALHLIRRIRNSFAHELSGISLDGGAHRDRIRELVSPFRNNDGYVYLLETFFGEKAGPADQFRTAVALVALRLEGACGAAKQIKNEGYKLIPEHFEDPRKKENETSVKTTDHS